MGGEYISAGKWANLHAEESAGRPRAVNYSEFSLPYCGPLADCMQSAGRARLRLEPHPVEQRLHHVSNRRPFARSCRCASCCSAANSARASGCARFPWPRGSRSRGRRCGWSSIGSIRRACSAPPDRRLRRRRVLGPGHPRRHRDSRHARGHAPRLAAERLQSVDDLTEVRNASRIDRLLQRWTSGTDSLAQYIALNEQFHSQLLDLAKSAMLRRALDRAITLPFASPNAFILGHAQKKEGREVVTISQMHHRAIVDAIANREPTRAEALARSIRAWPGPAWRWCCATNGS